VRPQHNIGVRNEHEHTQQQQQARRRKLQVRSPARGLRVHRAATMLSSPREFVNPVLNATADWFYKPHTSYNPSSPPKKTAFAPVAVCYVVPL